MVSKVNLEDWNLHHEGLDEGFVWGLSLSNGFANNLQQPYYITSKSWSLYLLTAQGRPSFDPQSLTISADAFFEAQYRLILKTYPNTNHGWCPQCFGLPWNMITYYSYAILIQDSWSRHCPALPSLWQVHYPRQQVLKVLEKAGHGHQLQTLPGATYHNEQTGHLVSLDHLCRVNLGWFRPLTMMIWQVTYQSMVFWVFPHPHPLCWPHCRDQRQRLPHGEQRQVLLAHGRVELVGIMGHESLTYHMFNLRTMPSTIGGSGSTFGAFCWERAAFNLAIFSCWTLDMCIDAMKRVPIGTHKYSNHDAAKKPESARPSQMALVLQLHYVQEVRFHAEGFRTTRTV